MLIRIITVFCGVLTTTKKYGFFELTYYSAWTTTTRTNNNKKFVSILFCFPVYLDALQNDKRMLIRIITVFCGVSNNKEIGFLWVDLL